MFAGFVCVYIFLQTFAIPGSIFLSIISGFLFPFPLALFAVCFCSATGYIIFYFKKMNPFYKYLTAIFRRIILLSTLLSGWKKISATLPPWQSGSVVSQGWQSQVQPPVLHSLSPDHSFPPKLVYQHRVTSHRCATAPLLDGDVLWCRPSLVHFYSGKRLDDSIHQVNHLILLCQGRDNPPAAVLHHGSDNSGDRPPARGVRPPKPCSCSSQE